MTKTIPALIALAIATLFSVWLVILLLSPNAWATFSEQGSLLLSLEWGRISLVDLYSGFFISLIFVWLFEPKLWLKLLVTLALPLLGNPVAIIWLAFRIKSIIKKSA